MYILFFLLWLIFNGQITLEIVIFGLLVAAVMYAFICKFMDYSLKKDLIIMKKTGYILQYIAVLIKEIVKANVAVTKLIISSRYDVEPKIVKFRTNLKTKTAQVVLANSITLTPGTITVSLQEGEFIVHCLDKELGEGLDTCIFERLLERLEGSVC